MKVEPWDFLRISIAFWDISDLVLGNIEYSIWQHCLQMGGKNTSTSSYTFLFWIKLNILYIS